MWPKLVTPLGLILVTLIAVHFSLVQVNGQAGGSGFRPYHVIESLQPDEKIPGVIDKYIFITQSFCRKSDDYMSVLELKRQSSKRYSWLLYMSPFFARNDRFQFHDGNLVRIPVRMNPVIEDRSRSMMFMAVFIFPFFIIFSIIGFLVVGIAGGHFVHFLVYYITHNNVKEWLRSKAIAKEKFLRKMEIKYTPDGGKIHREYNMLYMLRRSHDSSEPSELEEFDKELLTKHKRLPPKIPMMIKFAYFFKRKDLWLDPATNMIVPMPEPENLDEMTFEQLAEIKHETRKLELKLAQLREERDKFSAARRLVYNIPMARFYAIEQGLPYFRDLNRREIMLQVKKARREKKKNEALRAGLPDPYAADGNITCWLLNRLEHRKKGPPKKIVLTKLRPDKPNKLVIRKDHYTPTRFNPMVPGGGLLSIKAQKRIFDKRRAKAKTEDPELEFMPMKMAPPKIPDDPDLKELQDPKQAQSNDQAKPKIVDKEEGK